MPRHVAFLRAINIGGHTVKMTALKAHFEAMGFDGVETFIASGNVVFEAAGDTAKLERKIERHLHERLGYEVRTFVRRDDEVAALAAARPFDAAAMAAARSVLVGFLAEPLGAAGRKTLRALRTDTDDFAFTDREFWWLCHLGQSQSPIFRVPLEKRIGTATTLRNLNTVRRLAAKYPPVAPRRER